MSILEEFHILFFMDQQGVEKRHILNHLIQRIYTTEDEKKKYVIYINCAHGKGIRFIRDELKFFAKNEYSQ